MDDKNSYPPIFGPNKNSKKTLMETTYNYSGQEDLLSQNLEEPAAYAGFWLRAAAYIIDVIAVYAIIFIVALTMGLGMTEYFSRSGKPDGLFEILFLFLFLAILAYFPIMESSKWQATLGKKAVGIKVTDEYGHRIRFGKAVSRFLSKIVSVIILYIGFFMAGFTKKKQGLHDMIAGTLVVKA
jgi:uncharacterized RDD family membrane protein YckC